MMITLLILFFPLIASLLVFFSGNKLASTLALLLAVVELAITGYAFTIYQNSGAESFYLFQEWIHEPKISFHLAIDGLSLLMIILTNFLTPIIILSAFNRTIENAKGYFALILFMQFALIGVFMAMDG